MLVSSYSPFFMSGLSSPTPASHFTDLGPRRGSLPSDPPSEKVQSPSDESSTFYLNLQPRRDSGELLSFLSLDLAESQSLRSASLRRLTGYSSQSSTPSSRFERALLHKPPVKRSSPLAGPPETAAVNAEPLKNRDFRGKLPKLVERPVSPFLFPRNSNPLRSRKSGESMRSIPSPKPAPSISLPDVPASVTTSSSPILPKFTSLDLPPQLPSLPPSTFASLTQSPLTHRPSQSVPSFSAAWVLPIRRRSQRSASVSTSCRRVNRSDALACLEGRSEAADRIQPILRAPRDFIDLSDEVETAGVYPHIKVPSSFKMALNQSLEDLVAVSPSVEEPSSSPSIQTSPPSESRQTPPSKPSVRGRRRPSTIESWFPLVSFIDLRDDDLSKSWRSFIEISGTV